MPIPVKAAKAQTLAQLRAEMERFAKRRQGGLTLREEMRPEMDYRTEGDPKQIKKRNKRST